MADKYINNTGLLAIKQWIEGKFALDSDLDALDAKVDDIISEGGEPNVIETVKVNGTALTPDAQKAVNVTVPTATSDLTNNGDGTDSGSPFATQAYVAANGGKIDVIQVNGTPQIITNKTVNITMPTKVSDLTNDGDGTTGSEFATKSYVDLNGGKIDVIKVNGTAQTITNKEVNLAVPESLNDLGLYFTQLASDSIEIGESSSDAITLSTKLSAYTNDSNFQTGTQVDAKIASAVASAVTLKGSVATYANLPSTGQKHGDMYDVLDTGRNYVWLVENGTGRWDDYAGTMDLSAYWTSTTGQANTLEAMTVAEVNAILEPSA